MYKGVSQNVTDSPNLFGLDFFQQRVTYPFSATVAKTYKEKLSEIWGQRKAAY